MSTTLWFSAFTSATGRASVWTDGGGLISYVMPATTSASALTNLAVGVAGTANSGVSNFFVATIFLAGAFAGMGGLFVSQRIHAPARSKVLRESLKEPLLVCRTAIIEGSGLDAARSQYSPMA